MRFLGSHGEDNRRGKENKQGSHTPDDPQRVRRINTTSAGAVDGEFLFFCCYVCSSFEVREVFKKLPEGRGFILTEYEPVGSHGDPVHDNVYTFRTQS